MSEPVITLIGGPTALIEANGFRVLTDPTFDAPGEYQLPHVTLKKVAGPARTAEQIGQVDAVLLSHDQAYAMGAPRIFTTLAGAHRLGAPTAGLAPWQDTTISKQDEQSPTTEPNSRDAVIAQHVQLRIDRSSR